MCKCLAAMNKGLASKNTQITEALVFRTSPAKLGTAIVIATEKRDTTLRGKAVRALASHCPWCGAKLRGVSREVIA